MDNEKKTDTDKTTLSEEEIETEPSLGRRSMLSVIGTGLVGGAALSAASGCVVRTPAVRVNTGTGITDGDSGSYADPAGGGRGNTGVSDSDSGSYADPAGRGRGGVRHRTGTGITDSDSGNYADAAGHGRGNSGRTDSDSGSYADPAGRGRHKP